MTSNNLAAKGIMIKISSFYPFRNFLRVIQEFQEDKAIVKMKSLTFEREFEFEYKDVGEISDRFYANNSQMNFGFWLLFGTGVSLSVFCRFIYANPILLRIEQILYVCGLILYFTGFKKSWWIYFLDKNDRILTYIRQTSQNLNLIPKAIEMIRNRSESLEEISAANAFPEGKPAFEHIAYNFSDWMKTTDKFYEDEIIGFERSIFSESVYKVKYGGLSGKIYRGKSSDEIDSWVLTIVTLLVSIMGGFYFGFGIFLGIGLPANYLYIIFTLYALVIISISFRFVKREVIGFYDKNGNIEYWTHTNRTNKDKVEKIIEFVQSKIFTEEKK